MSLQEQLNRTSIKDIQPGPVTGLEISAIALDSVGVGWSSDGCTDFGWAVSDLAGRPFFDLRGAQLLKNGDLFEPLQTADLPLGYAIPHSSLSDNPGDGWTIVPHANSISSILSNLKPGDIVRAYNDATESKTSTDKFPGHEFIVVAPPPGKSGIWVVDNTGPAENGFPVSIAETQIANAALQPVSPSWEGWPYITNALSSHVYISRVDPNFVIPEAYADNPSTTGLITVNGASLTAQLYRNGDANWLRVHMVAGTAYTISLQGVSSSAGALPDPHVYLYDSTGHYIADEGSSQGTSSTQLSYTATTTADYFVGVRANNDVGSGTYTAKVTAAQIGPTVTKLNDATMWTLGNFQLISTYMAVGGGVLSYYAAVNASGFLIDDRNRTDLAVNSYDAKYASTFGLTYDGPHVLGAPSGGSAPGVDIIRVQQQDGSLFSAQSVDLDTESAQKTGVPVTFVGTTSNGAIVTQSFTLDTVPGLQTFHFSSNFTNLEDIDIVAGGAYQFDNLTLTKLAVVGTVISSSGGVTVGPGATWNIMGSTSTNTMTNNGVVAIQSKSSLTVTGSVATASVGRFDLNANATLEIAANIGSGDRIRFLAPSEAIVDKTSQWGINIGQQTYAGPLLQDFGIGDSVDLRDMLSSSVSQIHYAADSGILNVYQGAHVVANLWFETSSLGSGTFHVGSDGSGHALITHS